MKNLTKISCLVAVGLFCFVSQSQARISTGSEVTGTLSTGIDTGISGVVVTTPTASPVVGTYTAVQSVVLAATGANSIHYTFDGSEPTCLSAQVYRTGIAIPVSQSLTIKALACYANNKQSAVASFVYVINIATTNNGGGGGGGGSTPPLAVSKVGDIDKSGVVDIIDFAMMMANWDKTGVNSADLNGDLKVDIIDFALLMANWSI